ncbi:MAG: amidinotransferase [Sphingobacteriales bacterium]|nr:amidinotransferase [Sphingobacteriales bacterium]OJW01166.1 MAG: amidinotransferase [Sphingobacteriales bacterium 44-61]
MQTTSHILMIRPVSFVYNEETAVNNAFQSASEETTANVQQKALQEFDDFVALLRSNGVDVTVVEDTPVPHTPDSIFPNNWVSFHSNGTVLLYPMFAVNRRAERKPHVLDKIKQQFAITEMIDLSGFESENIFLEGTGSMVLDRDNRIAYACLSPRTDEKVLNEFCRRMQYSAVLFEATDGNGQAIYHTNVMMCVADRYIVICLESIASPEEQQRVTDAIARTGKTIIPITLKQMNHFAGNMLQVENNKGEKLLVMSTQAFESLTEDQVNTLSSFNRILHSSLTTIESNGGGSARCMMAEVHLPVLTK